MVTASAVAEKLTGFIGGNMNIHWKDAKDVEKKLFESISLLLGNNSHLLQFLFDPTRPKIKKRPGLLRYDSWVLSHGEQLLVRAALDIWSGAGHLQLWEMLETWDTPTWTNFIKAVCQLKDLHFDFNE